MDRNGGLVGDGVEVGRVGVRVGVLVMVGERVGVEVPGSGVDVCVAVDDAAIEDVCVAV